MRDAVFISDVLEIQPERKVDDRGYLAVTYSSAELRRRGLDINFPQENESLSRAKGTVRGLHFQLPPHAQGKLIRCVYGSIYNVAVDLRRGSETYGRYAASILSGRTGVQIYVPPGFAHGFCSISSDALVAYKLTAPFAPEFRRGLAWDDPDLGIRWPSPAKHHRLSVQDRSWPSLASLSDSLFSTPTEF